MRQVAQIQNDKSLGQIGSGRHTEKQKVPKYVLKIDRNDDGWMWGQKILKDEGWPSGFLCEQLSCGKYFWVIYTYFKKIFGKFILSGKAQS